MQKDKIDFVCVVFGKLNRSKISEYDLKGIGIDIEKIGSQYSFYNEWNGVYYFEEDCDADKLIKELNNKGYSVKFKYNHVGINFLNSPDIKRINA